MADALAKGKKPESSSARGGEDAFVAGTMRLWDWVQDNLRTLVVILAAMAIGVLGVLYYVNFQASVREQAAAELASLRMTATSVETLIPDLEAYIQRFEGTASADEAQIILARAYLDAGQAGEAARVASEVDAPADVPVGFAARRLLASAQEAGGDAEAALATLQSLARGARFDFQRRQVQAERARILVELGQLSEAAAIYADIAERAAREDPTEAGVYRLRLGEVRGMLEGAGS